MALIDKFGREVNYVRMSVTDRCDFRCVYCMAEEMTFLPRAQLLTLEEIAAIARCFAELGVKKIRMTGGEPLIRRDVMSLFKQLGQLHQLEELTLTTNGSQLDRYAGELHAAGVKRINISLDSLKADRFKQLTRTGDLDQVLVGIEAARKAGFARIKLNSVVMKNRNADEVLDLLHFAMEKGLDISYIEEMPLGAINEHDRGEEFCSSEELREIITREHTLTPVEDQTAGPSRYWRIEGADTRVGFISPHSHNFCDTCNRVRVSSEGRLLLCLGNEHSVDLKTVLRSHPGDHERLKQTIVDAMAIKPERHHFNFDEEPQIVRFMNTTGG